jgi:hypothetical protein
MDIKAIAEQILPANDTAGASQAGVIWFIDEALGGFRQAWADPVKAGLRQLNNSLQDGARFAELPWAEQTNVRLGRFRWGAGQETFHCRI